jgi:hypothetical protein
MNNRFDEVNHIFYIDDEQVPSITQIMPEQKYFVSKERLEELKIEGSENHAMIKMYFDTGDIFGDPMLMALDIWYQQNKSMLGNLLWHEKPLYSENYMFAGIPDAIFENAIIDFKRSFSNANYHALQLAGQYILAEENNICNTDNWYVAYYQNSKFKVKSVYNDAAETAFLRCIEKYELNQQIQTYLERNHGEPITSNS